MSEAFPPWTVGVVGHGVSTPEDPRYGKRPDLCGTIGHPGCTYAPSLDKTACLCGEVWYDGDVAIQCLLCCGGPLSAQPEPNVDDPRFQPSLTDGAA